MLIHIMCKSNCCTGIESFPQSVILASRASGSHAHEEGRLQNADIPHVSLRRPSPEGRPRADPVPAGSITGHLRVAAILWSWQVGVEGRCNERTGLRGDRAARSPG